MSECERSSHERSHEYYLRQVTLNNFVGSLHSNTFFFFLMFLSLICAVVRCSIDYVVNEKCRVPLPIDNEPLLPAFSPLDDRELAQACLPPDMIEVKAPAAAVPDPNAFEDLMQRLRIPTPPEIHSGTWICDAPRISKWLISQTLVGRPVMTLISSPSTFDPMLQPLLLVDGQHEKERESRKQNKPSEHTEAESKEEEDDVFLLANTLVNPIHHLQSARQRLLREWPVCSEIRPPFTVQRLDEVLQNKFTQFNVINSLSIKFILFVTRVHNSIVCL